jgi:hypothetical protein
VEKLQVNDGIGMPLTIELPGGGYASITEAQTMGWSGMTLIRREFHEFLSKPPRIEGSHGVFVQHPIVFS